MSIFLFSSCNKGKEVENEVEVLVAMTLSLEGQEMSRGNKSEVTISNDIYAVQVRSALNDNSAETQYSYGLFDNVDAMTLNLVAGKFYNVVVTCVKNGKSIIKNSGFFFRRIGGCYCKDQSSYRRCS